jgi:hypothetical protein
MPPRPARVPTPPTSPTHKSPVRRLIGLNAALLLALLGVTLAPSADAQTAANSSRARGEYTMVGGDVSGSTANAIYVVDAANREIITLLWDTSRRRLQGVGYRDLVLDLTAEPSR